MLSLASCAAEPSVMVRTSPNVGTVRAMVLIGALATSWTGTLWLQRYNIAPTSDTGLPGPFLQAVKAAGALRLRPMLSIERRLWSDLSHRSPPRCLHRNENDCRMAEMGPIASHRGARDICGMSTMPPPIATRSARGNV